jgi:hypothetical protein
MLRMEMVSFPVKFWFSNDVPQVMKDQLEMVALQENHQYMNVVVEVKEFEGDKINIAGAVQFSHYT